MPKVRRALSACDRGRSAAVYRARGDAIRRGHCCYRRWAREHRARRDEAWFKRDVVPKLASSLKKIGDAKGLSFEACSPLGAGAKVPHLGTGRRCASSRTRKRSLCWDGADP
jgi:hypothetical protein